MLKRQRGKDHPGSVVALAKAVEARMQEVSLLDIATRTGHWIGWHRHFGPLSGSDPKLADPLGRYAVITFTYGTNMGPYQMSRHLRGAVSPHEISAPGNQHVTPAKLNLASADVIDAFMALDVAGLWGDGSKVGADGTQIDTWDDNLLAETSIRYGGYGGIAYRHIADTYIALFSHFIPCGVWEAVFIFAGLLENASEVIVPEQIHADTQGQSLPAFGLATMLGVELLPRIRNWKDLIFYRASAGIRYGHIDSLFGEDEVIRLEADRDPLGRPDAGRDLHPTGAYLVACSPAAARQRVPQEPHLQGLPGAGPSGSAPSSCFATSPSLSCGRASPRSPTASSRSTTSRNGCPSETPGSSATTIPTTWRRSSSSTSYSPTA